MANGRTQIRRRTNKIGLGESSEDLTDDNSLTYELFRMEKASTTTSSTRTSNYDTFTSGWVGLAPSYGLPTADESVQSFLYEVQKGDKNHYSVFALDDKSAQFGGWDSDKVPQADRKITTFPTADKGTWDIKFANSTLSKGDTMKTYTQTNGQLAIIDPMYPFVHLATSVWNGFKADILDLTADNGDDEKWACDSYICSVAKKCD